MKADRGLGSFVNAPNRRTRYIVGGILLFAVLLVGAGVLLLSSSHATLAADGSALAKVEMPFGGGSIEKASAVTGPHAKPVPVHVQGNQIWPDRLVRAREQVSLEVTVKRSAPASWVAGSTEHLTLTLTTPSASLRTHYLTLRSGEPIVLRFKSPVQAISYGYGNGRLTRRTLSKPLTVVRLHRNADAGTISVAAVPRTWETSSPATVSWFPAGAAASGVVDPAPGTPIGPDTPLTLTFSKPAAEALHNQRPVLTPATAGSWALLNSHTIRFTPSGYGYGLGANVSVGLPSGVRLVGGAQTATSSTASWKVPPGSTLRLQQILAQLGYLPLRFTPKGSIGGSMIDQEAAAVRPPAGSFDWRYGNVPSALRSFWTPGSAGVMTQGALMAFQNDHGLTTDGVAGPKVWKTLFAAASSGKGSTFGYTFVSVDKAASPQSLSVWHSGHVATTALVNTGIASAPTASGTYPVFEHVPVTTMSGTNPDGSHYSDPGIQYVSYFNGGDALHAFTRGQYGFPQSLGCVEMDLASAAKVYPYTPIGTLVHVD